jgi:hypothetical protein
VRTSRRADPEFPVILLSASPVMRRSWLALDATIVALKVQLVARAKADPTMRLMIGVAGLVRCLC